MLFVQSIAIKEEAIRKLDVSENSKVYYGRFLRNGLLEMYCY